MAERTVTVDGVTHPLPQPFLVLATQNPVELAGTFPLPGGPARPLPVPARHGLPVQGGRGHGAAGQRRPRRRSTTSQPVTDAAGAQAMIDWAQRRHASRTPVIGYIIDLCDATRNETRLHDGRRAAGVASADVGGPGPGRQRRSRGRLPRRRARSRSRRDRPPRAAQPGRHRCAARRSTSALDRVLSPVSAPSPSAVAERRQAPRAPCPSPSATAPQEPLLQRPCEVSGLTTRAGLGPCSVAPWLLGARAAAGRADVVPAGLRRGVVLLVARFMGRGRIDLVAERSEPAARLAPGPAGRRRSRSLSARGGSGVFVLEERLHPHLGREPPVAGRAAWPATRGAAPLHDHAAAARRLRRRAARAVWTDPFGLTRRTTELLPATEVVVHPSTEPVHDRPLTRQWEDPPVRPPESKPWPSGFEFYGMRDYVRGDDLRRVVWKAVARTGRVLIRESEQGITDKVLHPPRHRPAAALAGRAERHLRGRRCAPPPSIGVAPPARRLLGDARDQRRAARARPAAASPAASPCSTTSPGVSRSAAPLTDGVDALVRSAPQRPAHRRRSPPTSTTVPRRGSSW